MAKLEFASGTTGVPTTVAAGGAQVFAGGAAMVSFRKTSGTGTAVLQVSFDDETTWETVVDVNQADVSFTDTGHKMIAYPPTAKFRVNVTAASSLVAALDIIYFIANTRAGGAVRTLDA